jgi:crotonobetainyl-CoA:carnitine CoA-transferase CaiB-like acyl-CoA transferase
VRVVALEQMQAVPFATQLLARLGADVVKVEHPVTGDLGRGSHPSIDDPWGRPVGATFLRSNTGKRSVAIDLKDPRGRDLVLGLARHADVFAENFRAGALDRLGLGYDAVVGVNPSVVYLSVSGFGLDAGAYREWPAFAPTIEAMSGLYEFKRRGDEPPATAPAGALGDIGAGLFGVIGVLAALRRRDATGEPQRVDIAMLDSVIAMTDLVTNFWSMGFHGEHPLICDGFRARDGWFVLQVGRRHQFERLAGLIGHPEWLEDPTLATPTDWRTRFDDVIRPAVESWAAGRTKAEAAAALNDAGCAAGPCNRADDVIADPHVRARRMLLDLEVPDGNAPTAEPVVVPGNPVKLVGVDDGAVGRVPWLGEHTRAVLADELGLDAAALDELEAAGVIGSPATAGS